VTLGELILVIVTSASLGIVLRPASLAQEEDVGVYICWLDGHQYGRLVRALHLLFDAVRQFLNFLRLFDDVDRENILV
jgi:hypothetical protein